MLHLTFDIEREFNVSHLNQNEGGLEKVLKNVTFKLKNPGSFFFPMKNNSGNRVQCQPSKPKWTVQVFAGPTKATNNSVSL